MENPLKSLFDIGTVKLICLYFRFGLLSMKDGYFIENT